MKIARVIVLAAAAAATACSGHSANSITPVVPAPVATQTPGATANAEFSIAIPAPAMSTQAHKAQYISAATRSVTIALQGGSKLGTFDVSPASPLCKSAADGSRTCTAGISAPAGSDMFAVSAFDQPNGTGNLLASGSIAQSISATSVSSINVDLTGVTASIKFTVTGTLIIDGSPASVPVVVQALDASGNTIIGTYDRTISLTDADPSGHTSLSATSVTASGSNVTLKYDGAHMTGSATVSAGAPGIAAPPSQTFQTTPAVVAKFTIPALTAPGTGVWGSAGIQDIVQGPDGNFWLVAYIGAIIKMTPDGHMTTYWTPTLASFPEEEVVGKDGAIWFTESSNNSIGRITTGGTITEFPIPTQDSDPIGICLGPDGNVWFAENVGNAIARVKPDGTITEFPLPASSEPIDLTAGPDGNLWIGENRFDRPSAIGVMSPSGTLLATHELSKVDLEPYGLISGPDGNVWFGEFKGDAIARMTPSGELTEYPTPSKGSGVASLAVAKDGDIWFTETGTQDVVNAQLGYITPGTSTVHEVPTNSGEHPRGLAVTSDGALWYSAFSPFGLLSQADEVGKVMP
jgi:streptogramin lyase